MARSVWETFPLGADAPKNDDKPDPKADESKPSNSELYFDWVAERIAVDLYIFGSIRA